MNNELLWKPLAKESLQDPYPMYRELRTKEPVHLAQTGEYIITRYEDVKHVLKSNCFETGNRLAWLKKGITYFNNKDEDFRAIHQALNAFILMLNGHQHQRIRNFVSTTWNDREVDDLIDTNITMLLEDLKKKEFDFVSEYAQPLPVYTISHILGIPVNDYRYLADLGIRMTKTLDLYLSLKDLVQIDGAARDFVAFFRELIRAKTDHPDEALFSRMIRKNLLENVRLSEEELVSIGIFLFVAAEETSSGLISNGLATLLNHPLQLATLRGDYTLVGSAIEEVLRYNSVVHLLGRISKEETVVGGKTIPVGAPLTLVIASANRDEEVFDQPDTFIISRTPNRHLAFGSGVHYCLGDWLARKQSQRAITRFLDQFPFVALADDDLSWYNHLAIRRLSTLNVRVS